ncbi:MAG: hypothetical protein ACOCVL_04060 [Candidatus Sumerlaeota bacterium]
MGFILFADNVRGEMLCGDVRLFDRGYQDIDIFGSEGRLYGPTIAPRSIF